MISFSNMRQFEADLDAFAKKLGVKRATVYRRVSLELWNGITFRTPVDTGRARSSWNLSIGNADPSWPSDGYGESGVTVMFPQPSEPDVSKVDGTQTVWITSNLPYIEPLEHGHSQQAPKGMVMLSIAETVAKIQLLTEPER